MKTQQVLQMFSVGLLATMYAACAGADGSGE